MRKKNICDEKFDATERLKQHKRACHECRKYPCDHCNYEATIKENLNTHSQYEHKNKSKNKNLYVNKRKKVISTTS